MLCEGGPHLFGALTAADLVDELCLTVSPLLAGPGPGRITAGDAAPPRHLPLRHVLAAEDGVLLLRHAARVTGRCPADTPTVAGVTAHGVVRRVAWRPVVLLGQDAAHGPDRDCPSDPSRPMTDAELDSPGEPVGRVLGTADATPLQFWVAVAPGQLPAARRRRGHPPRAARTGSR